MYNSSFIYFRIAISPLSDFTLLRLFSVLTQLSNFTSLRFYGYGIKVPDIFSVCFLITEGGNS